jgi:hypothetical protein
MVTNEEIWKTVEEMRREKRKSILLFRKWRQWFRSSGDSRSASENPNPNEEATDSGDVEQGNKTDDPIDSAPLSDTESASTTSA